jgi:predicted TIM-barrel fold metal-dependent hydrolase
MGFIDADAHIDECNDTWDYFPKSHWDVRPVEMTFDDGGPGYLKGRPSRGVFIDGEVYRHILRPKDTTGTTIETRELRDIPLRLKHMDELGIETQILFPTTFLTEVTARPEIEIPLYEAYNRWLGDRCKDSGGRLQWAAILPLHSIPDALRELRRAKEDGAIGVYKRGFECNERRAGDPYFHPVYELAQDLDMPVCIHIARPYTGHHNALSKTHGGIFSCAYTQDAFLSILMDGVAAKFPRLRFAFVEAAAGWLPYTLWLSSFEKLFTNVQDERALRPGAFAEVLSENRLFVTCEATENLPIIIDQVGDANLCVGSDYGHSDRAAIREAHRAIQGRTDLKPNTAERLTILNARALFGL